MGLVTEFLNHAYDRINLAVGRVSFHDDQHNSYFNRNERFIKSPR